MDLSSLDISLVKIVKCLKNLSDDEWESSLGFFRLALPLVRHPETLQGVCYPAQKRACLWVRLISSSQVEQINRLDGDRAASLMDPKDRNDPWLGAVLAQVGSSIPMEVVHLRTKPAWSWTWCNKQCAREDE